MTMTGSGALAARRRVPEILDRLDPADRRARRSRRDLARINALMCHPAIIARLLRRHANEAPESVLDLGGGDGSFMLAVARRLGPDWRGTRLVLLDRQPSVSARRAEAFAALGWSVEAVACDVFEWLADARRTTFDVIVANLFLHHFDDPDVALLMRAAAPLAPVFIATEPSRNLIALGGSHLLWTIGANGVTRHDAVASVCAGFAGTELSRLWPEREGDRIAERRVGPFTHAFAVSALPGPRP